MKFDFNKPFVDLEGKEVARNIGSQLAQLLSFSQGVDQPMKLWDWANKINKGEPLDLDTTDELVLMKFIEGSQSASTALKAQLLVIVHDASKQSKK